MPIATNYTVGNKGRVVTIPEEKSFYYWIEMESLEKVRLRFMDEGIISPDTGKPFSKYGIRTAAYRYLLYNHKELRPIMEEQGFRGTDDEWNIFLIHRALSTLLWSSKVRFMKWIKDNDFERYEYYYEDKIKHRSKNIRSIWT